MPIWPTLPPRPPGPLSATGRQVLATVRRIAASTPGTPQVAWAQALTDELAIARAAYDAAALLVADANPAGSGPGRPGTLSYTDLESVTGWSRATVIRMVRHGRERRHEEAMQELWPLVLSNLLRLWAAAPHLVAASSNEEGASGR